MNSSKALQQPFPQALIFARFMRNLDTYRSLLDKALLEWTPPGSPANLYEPVRYILSLGGKRLRPVMVLLAADMAGGRPEDALGPALAIEWFHNFSLLHDDIMDQAALRRGKPTVHMRYSANAAILSGDVMLVDAFRFLSQVPGELLPELMDHFSQTAVEVCQGQQLDMDFEKRMDVSTDEYLEMIRLKTAVLLGCSLFIGARVGGASVAHARSLYEFGEHLGLAFQLRDDLLDTYGDPEKFGKTVGGDILQDKKTYLFIHALQNAVAEDQAIIHHWVGNQSDASLESPADAAHPVGHNKAKVIAIRAVYDRCKAKEAAEHAIQQHHQAALRSLSQAGLNLTNQNRLRELAEDLLVREQ